MIAAACSGVTAIHHEFLSAQPGEASFFIERFGVVHQIGPGFDRVHVHLDHTGIRRDLEHVQTRIIRRRSSLDDDRHLQRRSDLFNCRQKIQVILHLFHRWHEEMQTALTRLNADRRADHLACRFLRQRKALRVRNFSAFCGLQLKALRLALTRINAPAIARGNG